MKRVITLGMMVVAVAMICGATAGTVTVTGVTAQQRYPWDGKVDIAVTISGTSNDVVRAECIFNATNSATHAALNVSHVTNIEGVSGSGSAWTRRFVWDAVADVGGVKIDDVVLSVLVPIGGVQLWEDGPYWAECNIGAAEPEECGYYFWWGDTVGYTLNGGTWVSSKGEWMSNSPIGAYSAPTYGKSPSQLKAEGWTDDDGNLLSAHDAATAHFRTPWRMPTRDDITNLRPSAIGRGQHLTA